MGGEIGAVLLGTRAALILRRSRSQQHEILITIPRRLGCLENCHRETNLAKPMRRTGRGLRSVDMRVSGTQFRWGPRTYQNSSTVANPHSAQWWRRTVGLLQGKSLTRTSACRCGLWLHRLAQVLAQVPCPDVGLIYGRPRIH